MNIPYGCLSLIFFLLFLLLPFKGIAEVPANAMAYGDSWICNLGYKMQGSSCIEMTQIEKKKQIEKEAENGGFIEAAVRVIMALLNADRIFERSEYEAAETIVLDHKELRKVDPFDMKRIVKQQAMILQADEEVALEVLPKMLKNKSRRKEVLRIAEQVLSLRGDSPNREEAAIAQKIKKILS